MRNSHSKERILSDSIDCEAVSHDMTAVPSREFDAAAPNDGMSDSTARQFPLQNASWIFPGLGCRYVGMGYDIIGHFESVARLIAIFEGFTGLNVEEVCLTGSGRKQVPARQEAQVIYLLDCAYSLVLQELGCVPRAVCGHSLGSFAATTVSGTIDFSTGLELVTTIEQLLEELVDGTHQAMGVIIGWDETVLTTELASHPEVSIANRNSPLQFVIGGPELGVDQVLEAAQRRGVKQARRLVTGRAMHTPHMHKVAQQLRERLKSVRWSEPRVPIVSCQNGETLRTSQEVREFLSSFLVQPVQWQAAVNSLRQNWGHEFLECGPGTVLSGMMPFIDSSISIRTASDILNQKVQ